MVANSSDLKLKRSFGETNIIQEHSLFQSLLLAFRKLTAIFTVISKWYPASIVTMLD